MRISRAFNIKISSLTGLKLNSYEQTKVMQALLSMNFESF